MAGLVLGAGAGMLFLYHMLLASHTVATQPLSRPAMVTPAATAAAKPAQTTTFNAEHAAALREAMKPAKG